MFRSLLAIALVLAGSASLSACGQIDVLGQNQQADINTPDPDNFKRLLGRELTSYFTATCHRPVRVEYELLKFGGMQSDGSFPKYFLWIQVYGGERMIEEGALKVAAVEKAEFQVLDFVKASEIKHEPRSIQQIFPEALWSDLTKKAEAKGDLQ